MIQELNSIAKRLGKHPAAASVKRAAEGKTKVSIPKLRRTMRDVDRLVLMLGSLTKEESCNAHMIYHISQAVAALRVEPCYEPDPEPVKVVEHGQPEPGPKVEDPN